MTTWRQLKKGDVFTCPDGRGDCKVLSVKKAPGGRVVVRTNRHDHYRNPADQIEVKSTTTTTTTNERNQP